MKTLIRLPDGTQIASGSQGAAILSFKLTQCVNSKQELTLGSSCAAMAEMKLLLPEGIRLEAGQELEIYQVDEMARKQLLGIFVTQEPVWTGHYQCKVTAFDRMIYTDRDLTTWLAGLTGWPYTLQQLAEMVCDACGLELTGEPLPNGELPVQAFAASDITGRDLLQWIGEAAGRFCRATPQGKLEFAWYIPAGRLSLGPESAFLMESSYWEGMLTLELTGSQTETGVALEDGYLQTAYDGDGHVTLLGKEQQYYFMGGLERSDYTVCPIEKVQIRATPQDVGTVYPQAEGQMNTYIIQGNPLLATQSGQSLLDLAQDLYLQLQEISYTPCKVTLPANDQLQPGQILRLTDSRGSSIQMLIMEKERTGQKDVLSCTGAQRRDSTTAVNQRQLQALSGKVLELRTDVDGLLVKNADAQGRTAQLEVNLEGLKTQISRQESGITMLTQLQQDAQKLKLQVQQLEAESGRVVTSTGYSFTDEGLYISKTGQEMESRVDHTGLYVSRGGQTVLQAGNRGVEAVDVTVGNYLVVGSHARFEDYEGGTACFYI